MPTLWQRVVAASIAGLGLASTAIAQTLPIPGALTPPSAVRVDVPGGPRTPASAVSATPPPPGIPVAEVSVQPVGDAPPPETWVGDAPPVDFIYGPSVAGLHHMHSFASDEAGFLFSIDYLLLRPRRGGFDFAINDPGRDGATVGTVESLNYELRSGVRPSLGYRIGETRWDVLAEYTYFRSSAGRDVPSLPTGVLYPTVTRPGFIDEASYAHAYASIEYNTFDAVIGRRFCVDDHLGIRMFGGFRWATIRQDEVVQFDGIDAQISYTQSKSSFDGFGPILGGEVVWAGWKGFHLYARASGGLLTGQTKNPLVELNNLGGSTYVNLDYDSHKVVPVAGVGIGGGWQYRMFSLRVGYEITNYIGLIDQPRFTDDVSRGNMSVRTGSLSLEGLFAQFGFSF